MNCFFKFLGLIISLMLTACAQLPPEPAKDAPIAQCPVCRHCRDWDCLNVKKSASAPHLVSGGKEYWFCSTACRTKFAKSPEIYKN